MSYSATKYGENPTAVKAALFPILLMVALLATACARYSFFEPEPSNKGAMLQLTIEQIDRVEEVAYSKGQGPERALVFMRDGSEKVVDSLVGTSWILGSMQEIDVQLLPRAKDAWYQLSTMLIPGIDVTLTFVNDGEMHGNTGCNDFSSNNSVAIDGLFDAGMLAMSEKRCEEPEGLMEQEAEFLELLGEAESYSVRGETLTLTIPKQRRDYTILPSSEENELVMIRARIGNNVLTLAKVDIETWPPELRMDTGRYHSVNISEAQRPIEGFRDDLNEYVPFMEDVLLLEKGDELEGWLIFDVPKGSVAESFKWEAGGDVKIVELLSKEGPG